MCAAALDPEAIEARRAGLGCVVDVGGRSDLGGGQGAAKLGIEALGARHHGVGGGAARPGREQLRQIAPDRHPVDARMSGDDRRRRLYAGELPGGEGAHIGLHDGMLRNHVDPVAARDDVDGDRGLLRRVRQTAEGQGHAGRLQRRVAALLGLQARMGGAAGELQGQGRGALARH